MKRDNTTIRQADDEVDLDRARLATFTGDDPIVERELVTLYCQTANGYLVELSAALANPDRWHATCHALKGASLNIGAMKVARLARESEEAGPATSLLEDLAAAVKGVSPHCC